ncbi:MAG: N-formylglutamate amidohydrolase [Melioribacteraceae bacterium]|nr:MAG: N-formylglutamate amidohydrolase [Melioribacteraceae bacterium]
MTKYIFTCEHGGNEIPNEYKYLFKAHRPLLKTHRAYDIGILEIFKEFVKHFNGESFYSETSRLLIELNRSLHHQNLFSEITRILNNEAKQRIINNYYKPYRDKVENGIVDLINQNNKVIHISFHSFTTELNGVTRKTDIGLLYDSKSTFEKVFCKNWKAEINRLSNLYRVRFNYPYLGVADGFTSYLRNKYGSQSYCGIELEINQKHLQNDFNKEIMLDLIINSFKSIS